MLFVIVVYGGKAKSTNLSWDGVGLGWVVLEFDKKVTATVHTYNVLNILNKDQYCDLGPYKAFDLN